MNFWLQTRTIGRTTDSIIDSRLPVAQLFVHWTKTIWKLKSIGWVSNLRPCWLSVEVWRAMSTVWDLEQLGNLGIRGLASNACHVRLTRYLRNCWGGLGKRTHLTFRIFFPVFSAFSAFSRLIGAKGPVVSKNSLGPGFFALVLVVLLSHFCFTFVIPHALHTFNSPVPLIPRCLQVFLRSPSLLCPNILCNLLISIVLGTLWVFLFAFSPYWLISWSTSCHISSSRGDALMSEFHPPCSLIVFSFTYWLINWSTSCLISSSRGNALPSAFCPPCSLLKVFPCK
jgi:hypothetical protein